MGFYRIKGGYADKARECTGNAATATKFSDGKSSADFAPSGYGVGGYCKDLSNTVNIDLDNLLLGGNYVVRNVLHAPNNNMEYLYVSVLAYHQNWVIQIAYEFFANNNGQKGRVYLRQRNEGAWAAWKQLATLETNLTPNVDNAYSLGTSSQRWSSLWAASPTINTSDKNAKKDIVDTQLGLDFISKLRPVQFKYKTRENTLEKVEDGTEIVIVEPEEKDENGNVVKEAVIKEITKYKEVVNSLPGIRTHLGLIAQEVEEALEGKDMAVFTKDEETKEYGLRYEELIAPLIKSIQELKAIVGSQATEIAKLKAGDKS